MSINETRITSTSTQSLQVQIIIGYKNPSYVQYLKQTLSPSSFPTQRFL